MDASLAGVHRSDRHSMTNDTRKISQSLGKNGIDAYRAPRARSADTINLRRSNRSANTPANGPNTTDGSRRASITPATASPPFAAEPPSRATSVATATNPTQSPSEETSMARHRRENEGWTRRSLKVALRVPRMAAISSATLATAPETLPVPVSSGRTSGPGPGGPPGAPALPRGLRAARGPGLRHQGLGLLLGELGALGVPGPAAVGAPLRPAPRRHHQSLAGRAGFGIRLLVHREVALRVAAARVERTEPALSFEQLPLLALRAGDPGGLGLFLLYVLALRVAGAPHERPVPAGPLDQVAEPALGALLAGGLGLGSGGLAFQGAGVLAFGVALAADEHPVPAQALEQPAWRVSALLRAQGAGLVEVDHGGLDLALGPFDVLVEGFVELPDHLDPRRLGLGDVVELLLHLRGEADVDDVAEVFDQDVVDHHADVLGEEPLVVQPHVTAVQQHRDDRGVGRGPADAVLLQRLHQGSLRVAGGRLGEVLLRQELQQPQDLLRGELGEAGLGVLVGRVVRSLEVDPAEAVELQGLARGPQEVDHGVGLARGFGFDVHGDLVEHGLAHLRGHRALPDQPVQPGLVP